MDRKTEIVSASNVHVTVREVSGITSVYHTWRQFYERPDADELCLGYVNKCEDLAQIVRKKMVMH